SRRPSTLEERAYTGRVDISGVAGLAAAPLVVRVEDRAAPETRVDIAELAAEPKDDVLAVGEPQQVQLRLDAVEGVAPAEIVEMRPGGDRPHHRMLSVDSTDDELAALDGSDTAAAHGGSALVRSAKRRNEGAVAREDVDGVRAVDQDPAVVDAEDDGARCVRVQRPLRPPVELPDHRRDLGAEHRDRADHHGVLS